MHLVSDSIDFYGHSLFVEFLPHLFPKICVSLNPKAELEIK